MLKGQKMSKKSVQRRSPKEASEALSINEYISRVMNKWNLISINPILHDMALLLELFDFDEDWLKEQVGDEDEKMVRLIRTLYLYSLFCDRHIGTLVEFNAQFPKLWVRLEKAIGRDTIEFDPK